MPCFWREIHLLSHLLLYPSDFNESITFDANQTKRWALITDRESKSYQTNLLSAHDLGPTWSVAKEDECLYVA